MGRHCFIIFSVTVVSSFFSFLISPFDPQKTPASEAPCDFFKMNTRLMISTKRLPGGLLYFLILSPLCKGAGVCLPLNRFALTI